MSDDGRDFLVHPDQLDDAIDEAVSALQNVAELLARIRDERLTGYITIKARGSGHEQWQVLCPYHGEIVVTPMTLEGHEQAVTAWNAHERAHNARTTRWPPSWP